MSKTKKIKTAVGVADRTDPYYALGSSRVESDKFCWDGQRNILQKFTSAGWAGGKAATKYEKTVNLNRVKAELGFSAANYFSMVYEKVSSLVNTHMDDISGTELEQADTALFKHALAEHNHVTMWIGDTSGGRG